MHMPLLCLLIYNVILWSYFTYKHFLCLSVLSFAFCLIKIFKKYAFISFADLETIDYSSFHLVDTH